MSYPVLPSQEGLRAAASHSFGGRFIRSPIRKATILDRSQVKGIGKPDLGSRLMKKPIRVQLAIARGSGH